MSCILNSGVELGCSAVGGIEKLWLGTWSSDATYTMNATNVITGTTSASTVYLFETDLEIAGLNQNGVFTRENGTVHYETVVSAKFFDLTAALRNTVLALGKAPLVAIVKSNSGLYYIAGVESAGRATAGSISLGTAMSDMNGSNIEITFKSQNGAYLIDGALIGTSIVVG